MTRFESLYKKYVKKSDYKCDPNKDYKKNILDLRQKAMYENTCKILYEKLDGVYGEDYAEYVLTKVLDGTFTITQHARYPFKEYKFLSDRLLVEPHLHDGSFQRAGNPASKTLLTFYPGVVRDIISASKVGAECELYDFLMCFALLYKKWMITDYPRYVAVKNDSMQYVNAIVKNMVYSFYAPETEDQSIVITILDKYYFTECMKLGNYSTVLEVHSGETLTLDYDMYLEGVKAFMNVMMTTQGHDGLLQPKVRVRACASSKLQAEVLELIAKHTKLHIGVIYEIFKGINYDLAHGEHFLESKEWKDAFEELEKMKFKKPVNFLYLKHKLKDIFATDYINYLNVACKPLANFLRVEEVEKKVAVYEAVLSKILYDLPQPTYKNHFSCVTIDAKKMFADCESEEEFAERVYKATLDAHSINHMRAMLCVKEGRVFPERSVAMVQINGLEEEQYSLAWAQMTKACKYLQSTYGLQFMCQIVQRVYFRDRSRICYEIL